ncbi:hypothetical protein SAY86_002450 [Trapa natans]|uniref:Uncharacterized protein n=1 Tax=Trapa natans TaxID=22666 RepID=A0AAN7R3C7_TRANT|nr:hypothetical protein SAY86_002450 [Trapa natans]
MGPDLRNPSAVPDRGMISIQRSSVVDKARTSHELPVEFTGRSTQGSVSVNVTIQSGQGSVTRTMLKEEGLGAFYKGLSAGLLGQATYTTAGIIQMTAFIPAPTEFLLRRMKGFWRYGRELAGPTVVRAMVLNMGILASYDRSVEFSKDLLGFGEAATVIGFFIPPLDGLKKERILQMKTVEVGEQGACDAFLSLT